VHGGDNEATLLCKRRPYINRKTRKHNKTSYHFTLYHQHLSSAMKIEWASHFRSDGTRRRPPPSAMHGWLAKMRGTLIGDEDLRSKGMREMRDAKSRKRYTAKLKQQRSATSRRTVFSFLGIAKSKKSQPTVISKRKTASPKPSHRDSRPSSRVRSPATSPGRPSPRHRSTVSSAKSYRMPGHYDLSQPRRNNRRSTT